jgi:uncharacterized surface protein with fasciclin (FAS1) repeats
MKSKWKMKKKFLKQWLLIIFAPAVIFVGCNKIDNNGYNPDTTTIAYLLSSGTNTTIFNSAVIKANLDTVFGGSSLFTLFVPNDEACTQDGYTMDIINGFTQNQAKDWVLYQTYAGAVLNAASFIGKTEEKLIMANGDSVFVTGDSNRTYINGYESLNAQASATNGVMHAMGNVLVAPKLNLYQMVNNDTALSFLHAAILLSTAFPDTLKNTLSSGGPFSFLATDNDAFRKLGYNSPADLETVNPDYLRSIVQTSMIPQRLFSYDVADSSTFKTVNDSTLIFHITGILATVQTLAGTNTSNVVSANVMAINGVLYKIDEILYQ